MLIIFTLICNEQNIYNSNTNVDISKSKHSKNDNNDQYDEDDHSDDDDTGHGAAAYGNQTWRLPTCDSSTNHCTRHLRSDILQG